KELNHAPGAEFIYSNTNYNLFAVLVQRLSGMSLADFTNKFIFQPAGMNHTQWRSNFKKVVPNRAIAYSLSSAGFETDMPNEYVYGNGGLLTTAEDLVKWNEYYTAGKLGSPSLLPKQITTAILNNGNSISYAAGLYISKYKGWQAYTHDGATAGYRSQLEFWPELGLSIAFLSNTSQFDTSSMNVAELVADIFINDKSAPAVKPAANLKTIPVESFSNKTGWYKDTRNGGSQKIFIRDGKIYSAPNNLLKPVNENMLQAGNNTLLFESGFAKQLKFITSGKDTFIFIRVDSALITPVKLQEYIGNYYSEEAEALYQVKVKNDKLIIHMDPASDRTLTPTYNDGFSSGGNLIYFERDKKNKVTTMRISSGRVRNLAFRRTD
ncbi:MAG: serine hydrolase domain-containing protein, partial [Ferruginibacter sp.]